MAGLYEYERWERAVLKAIETVYNGYRFRSRLEARWAVFFDALGLRYDYEPEGFDLGESGWYLPDFWLPDLGMWLEVKPECPSPVERDKAEALFWQGGDPVLVGVGQPGYGDLEAFCFYVDNSGGGVDWFGGGRFELEIATLPGGDVMRGCPWVGVDVHRDVGFMRRAGEDWQYVPGLARRSDAPDPPELTRGYLAARQARFEYGQTA